MDMLVEQTKRKLEPAALLAVLGLVVAACGGAADTGGSDSIISEPPATTAAEPPVTTSGSGSSGSSADDTSGEERSGSELNTALITVGDQTYEFEWATSAVQLCDPDLFGGFVAIAATTSDVESFEAEFPPPDDPDLITPKIEVTDPENDLHWTADPEENLGATVEDWPAQVDSHQIDGNTVTGTATFVGSELTEGVPGTFEITCAAESS
jgi:hypothetical protein